MPAEARRAARGKQPVPGQRGHARLDHRRQPHAACPGHQQRRDRDRSCAQDEGPGSMGAGIQAAGPGMHLQAARPAGRPAAASPPPSRGAALSESGPPAASRRAAGSPDPALRRGHDLHARLRSRPGEPLRHLPPLAIQRAGQVPRVLPAGMASPGPVRISA